VTGAISATGGGGSITAATTLNAPTLTITNGTASGAFTGLQVESKANGTTAGWVPPVYTNAGAATAATEHTDRGTTTAVFNGSCSAGAYCTLTGNTVTFTNSFASGTSYQCELTQNIQAGSTSISAVPVVFAHSASTLTVSIFNASNAAINSNPTMGIDYICSGT
jgi:hypothetical protein